jgi:hypothetical protein
MQKEEKKEKKIIRDQKHKKVIKKRGRKIARIRKRK